MHYINITNVYNGLHIGVNNIMHYIFQVHIKAIVVIVITVVITCNHNRVGRS